MNKLKKNTILHKVGLLAPMICFMVIYMVWFEALEDVSGISYHVIHSALDDYIPFCEYFIIPYYMWFIFVPVFIIYLLIFDEEVFKRTIYILMAGMLIFLVVSTFYPTIQNLRPYEMPSDNIFCQLVSRLYAMDTPTNVLPSIHVFNTMTGVIALYQSRMTRPNDGAFRTIMAITGALVVLSTVFLKQHSTWDVFTAVVMYAVCRSVLSYALDNASDARLAPHESYRS